MHLSLVCTYHNRRRCSIAALKLDNHKKRDRFENLICGDRNWSNYTSILNVMKRLKAQYGDITVIQGEARGADTLAKRAALECGPKVIGYPAEWNKYGKTGGPRRNQQMLQKKPDMVIAFHSNIGVSRGTKDMVNRANRAGIKTFLFTD